VASYGVNAIFVYCRTVFYVAENLREIIEPQIVCNGAFFSERFWCEKRDLVK